MTQPSGAPLIAGTRVGAYEILGPIGSGGMGQVYRARDTKLERDVALKILPRAFASDPDRVMRFTREAKTLATLNHPHIAQIYDAGRDGDTTYIAMELVHGEDLSYRIQSGAVPLKEALQIARQTADALAAAHDAGIVHRDLKPANIKVTDDGIVKVLDFGLAKGTAADGSSTGDSAATMTSPAMTAMGLILGTASYMSPEQAKGKPIDRRTDVWAFAVVLYEMLTGKRLFGRDDVSDTLAAVLTQEPDLAKLPASTPQAIKQLLGHCLTKDRRQRLDSMTAARIEIEDVLAGKTGAPDRAAAAAAGSKALAMAGLLAVGAIAGAVGVYVSGVGRAVSAPAETPLVAQIAAPVEVISAFHDGFALSPDGATVAFAARNSSGVRQIWLRRLEASTARPVQGTDGGAYPFWAPDGRAFGFFAEGKLKRIDVDGGRLQTLCDAPGSFPSASWNRSDEILWAANRGALTRVLKISAGGGNPVPLDALGTAMGPVWLSDGRRFLYALFAADTAKTELRLASADFKSSKPVLPIPGGAKNFAYGGGLLFTNRNKSMAVQRFDEASESLVGAAVPIAGEAGQPKEWYAVSTDGHRVVGLVQAWATDTGDPGDPMARLIWVDRQGNAVGSLGDPGRYWTLRLMPDGRNAIVNPGDDLWLLRPEGRHTRLTTTGANSLNSYAAVVSPDGREMVHIHRGGILQRRVDAQSTATPLQVRGIPSDWSSDGRWLLLYGRTDDSTTTDIIVYDTQSGKSRPWLASEFTEMHPRFSPDGAWVAYASNLTGRQEIYVRPFEGEGQAVAVSTNGGGHPFWRRDGNELYFLDPGDDVMAVTMKRTAGAISPGKPQRLFRIPLNDITRGSFPPYAVAPDGQQFLLNVPDKPTPLFLMQGLAGVVK